jgi:hypothetical protein
MMRHVEVSSLPLGKSSLFEIHKYYKIDEAYATMLRIQESAEASLLFSIFSISFLLLFSNELSYNSQTAAAQTLPGPEPNYLLYSNPTYGIKLQYPADWQHTEGGVLERLKANNTVAVAEFHPADMSVGVTVSVEKLLKNETLDQYVEESINLTRQAQPNVQLIEQNETTTLTGLPGYRLVWNGIFDPAEAFESGRYDFGGLENVIDLQPFNTTVMTFTTIQGDNGYIIGYSDSSSGMLDQVCNTFGADFVPFCPSSTSMTDSFSRYLPIVQNMIDSFQISATSQNQAIDSTNNNFTMPNNTTSIPPTDNTQLTNENPCAIIDRRLATGEITIEEYQRLHEVLQC